jgi:hypothetical protein
LGHLASESEPDEALDELVDAEQQRQGADDQFAPCTDSTQRLHSNAANHDACGEVSLW